MTDGWARGNGGRGRTQKPERRVAEKERVGPDGLLLGRDRSVAPLRRSVSASGPVLPLSVAVLSSPYPRSANSCRIWPRFFAPWSGEEKKR